MGYYTNYNLEASHKNGADLTPEDWAKVTKFVSENFEWFKETDFTNMTFKDVLDWDSYKWYDRNEDMSKLSEAFPDISFELEGYGDEQDDHWKKTWEEGVVVHEWATEFYQVY